MTSDKSIIVRVRLPTWFLYFYAIGGSITLAIFSAIWVGLFHRGFSWSESEIWKSVFLLLIAVFGIKITPITFSSMTVSEAGFNFYRFGRLKRVVRWAEIARVSLPRFGIPYEAIYLFLTDGEKIILMKSMNGYRELLQLIYVRARDAQIDDAVLTLIEDS